MSEALLQAQVIQLARHLGYRYMHIHDSRKSSGAGFPDLVLAHKRTGRVIFVELKAEKGRLSPSQEEWLAVLGKRHETHLWRPEDWESGEIPRVLSEAA